MKGSPSGNYLIRKHNVILHSQFKPVFLAPGSGREVHILFSPSLAEALDLFLPQMACLLSGDTKRRKTREVLHQMTAQSAKSSQVTVAALHKAQRIGDGSCTVARRTSSEKAKRTNWRS